MVKEKSRSVIFADIRRYYCKYCGVCRSKKSLISTHILSHHQDEVKREEEDKGELPEASKTNACQECGVHFKKPAYLRQHMQSHSLEVGGPPEKIHQASLNHAYLSVERPFICPVDDCHSSYRRKDHLTRHLLQHQGKLFECPVGNCKRRFAFQGNMKRHMKELHKEPSSSDEESLKQYVCPEIGCGKVFKFASKLRKHEDSHVKLETVEAFCSEPGCMKYFTNEQCLKEHVRSCHLHIICEICGTRQLKKNIKRHLRMHEAGISSERIKCSYDGCAGTFSTMSNLKQHIKATHLKLKPFFCNFAGCGKNFSFKHVRDHHERSTCHVYTHGDFEESDEQFRSRPRGGRKRKYPGTEILMRKRIVPPCESDLILNHGSDYLSRLLSSPESEDEL